MIKGMKVKIFFERHKIPKRKTPSIIELALFNLG
jgi:hypothetical protein